MTGAHNKEIRCGHCNRLLAKGEALYLELKCPRCGAYTILRATSAKSPGLCIQCAMNYDCRFQGV